MPDDPAGINLEGLFNVEADLEDLQGDARTSNVPKLPIYESKGGNVSREEMHKLNNILRAGDNATSEHNMRAIGRLNVILETIDKLNEILRARNATIKDQASRLAQCKALFELANITAVNCITDQPAVGDHVDQSAGDHPLEKIDTCEAAWRSLEWETRDVSTSTDRDTVKLSCGMQEIDHVVGEKQSSAKKSSGDEPSAWRERALQEEIDDLKRAMEAMTVQREASRERERKCKLELNRLKGQARRIRPTSILMKLWWLVQVIGVLAFLIEVYVTVSQHAACSSSETAHRRTTY